MVGQPDETTPLNPAHDGSSSPQVSYQSLDADSSKPIVHSRQLPDDEENDVAGQVESTQAPVVVASVRSIIAVLLLGEFVSNMDASLIMASTGRISSEFNQLQGAGWLSTGYTLGLCAVQPMYGKLSDIYGRKPLLLASYFLLALGCIVCGIAGKMGIVIVGRVVSGMGGAGIMAMGSIIITDIVPKREIAKWRAYINIWMTLGRSVGGPLGGVLTDTIGWRWAFLLQPPVLALAAVLVVLQLKLVHPSTANSVSNKPTIRRIDFPGVVLIATSITAIILLFDQGGKLFPWLSLPALLLASIGAFTLASFVYVEKNVATEPIFDLRILSRPNVASSYITICLQIAAQVGMMFSVPLYFQVTAGASTTVAGAHLVPAVVGNTIGGLIAGIYIRRTGNYKPILALAGLVASVTYALQLTLWNGHTGFWESLYITPGGLGTGFAASAAFVGMTAFLEAQEVAMATGGFLLLMSFAMTAGVTTTNTVLGLGFKGEMQRRLQVPDAEEIIKRALSSTEYIAGLPGPLHEIVVNCYVNGLKHAYTVSLVCSLLASITALTVRNHRI